MKNIYYLQYQILILSLSCYYLFYTVIEFPYIVRMFSVDYGYNSTSDFGGLFKNYYIYIVNNIPLLKALFLSNIIFCIGLLIDKTRKASLFLMLLYNYFFQRISVVDSIEIRFINFLILLMLVIPEKKFELFKSYKSSFWKYPKDVQWIAYLIAGVAYTMGGYYKLLTKDWMDGHYLLHMYTHSHLRRFDLDFLFNNDIIEIGLKFINYLVLCIEVLALPMMLFPVTRFLSVFLLTGMQLGILLTINLSQISLGMLIFHIFLIDPKWFKIFKKSNLSKN